jgi:hypothetical protein
MAPKPAKKHWMRLGWVLLHLLLLFGMNACDRREARAPEELGYRVFADAVRRGDSAAAWANLSQETQALMNAKAKAISEASKGVVKNEPALMMFQSGIRPPPLGDVKMIESDGGAAMLEGSATGEAQRIRMVREGGRWVVDLSDIFREAKQP